GLVGEDRVIKAQGLRRLAYVVAPQLKALLPHTGDGLIVVRYQYAFRHRRPHLSPRTLETARKRHLRNLWSRDQEHCTLAFREEAIRRQRGYRRGDPAAVRRRLIAAATPSVFP